MVLIDIEKAPGSHGHTVCLDYSIIKELTFTTTGFYVWLYLPAQTYSAELEVEIMYSDITQIVCFYDELGYQSTLFCKNASKQLS